MMSWIIPRPPLTHHLSLWGNKFEDFPLLIYETPNHSIAKHFFVYHFWSDCVCIVSFSKGHIKIYI